MRELYLILDNLRSVHNVGSLFRTADAARVTYIYVVGTTPTPLDRFGLARRDFAKVALGAERSIPWTQYSTLAEAIAGARTHSALILGIEQDTTAQNIFDWQAPADQPLALVLGPEVAGLPPEDRALCDVLLEIPQYGTKESLNVSVAGGVALFEMRRKIA